MICLHPDCQRKLSGKNRSGVCINHTGYRPPAGKPTKVAVTEQIRQGKRDPQPVKITLPRAPWENEHA